MELPRFGRLRVGVFEVLRSEDEVDVLGDTFGRNAEVSVDAVETNPFVGVVGLVLDGIREAF